MTPTLLALRSFWLETPASTSAVNHDWVFYILLNVMAFFFFLVIAIMLLFVVIYRRRSKNEHACDDAPTHNTPLEVTWTIVPLFIVLGFFVIGMKYYVDLESPPAGADVVDVEASQWRFTFKYPNGAESDDLYLRVDKPVIFRLTSKDVSHAVYITAFRMGRNAVPGRNTQFWVTPTELTGVNPDSSFHVFCTQYCGNGHAEMHANCFVLNQEDFDKKLAEAANIFVDKDTKKPLPLKDVGEKLYKGNCAQCHTVTEGATNPNAPTWRGLYKSSVTFDKSNEPDYKLTAEDSDEKWDAYLVESILHPEVKIVHSYQNVMPSQESSFSDGPGQRKLADIVAAIESNKPTTNKEKRLVAITEYIKSVGASKYYKPIKTPETYASETAQAGADGAKSPAAKPAKSEAPASEKKSDAPATDKKFPPGASARDRVIAKPADEPVDKSASPSPTTRKEETK